MKKIGLALGGGGARGLTHIGILRAFERERIPIHSIAGTSMGSIIGACYAVEPDIDKIEARVKEVLAGSMFSKLRIDFLDTKKRSSGGINLIRKTRSFIVSGYLHFIGETQYAFMPLEKLEQFVNVLLPDIDMTETKIPYACVATDLTNGREKIFTKGSLRKSVLSSSSIPGVFPPVYIGGIYYTDGGAVNVTPVKAVKMLGGDFIIACDVKSRIVRWEEPEKASEIMSRSNYITGVLLNKFQLKEADMTISPAVRHIHWTGFDKMDFMIKKGEKATLQKMWEIKTAIKPKSLWERVFEFFKQKK